VAVSNSGSTHLNPLSKGALKLGASGSSD